MGDCQMARVGKAVAGGQNLAPSNHQARRPPTAHPARVDAGNLPYAIPSDRALFLPIRGSDHRLPGTVLLARPYRDSTAQAPTARLSDSLGRCQQSCRRDSQPGRSPSLHGRIIS